MTNPQLMQRLRMRLRDWLPMPEPIFEHKTISQLCDKPPTASLPMHQPFRRLYGEMAERLKALAC
jgi:hypothetical protein